VAGPDSEAAWWTFAGEKGNASLAPALADASHSRVTPDSFAIRFEQRVSLSDVERAIAEVRSKNPAELLPAVDEEAIDGLKFAECLPAELALHAMQQRLWDRAAVESVISRPVRIVSQ
jgi:ATP-dependent Lhr-like helicase